MLRDFLLTIAQEYTDASGKDFSGHPVAARFRNDAPRIFGGLLDAKGFLVKGSAGQGNWAAVPWVSVFNPEVTTSAQHGPYVVYLFSFEQNVLYAAQMQGVTQVRQEFGRKTHDELRRRSDLIRARVPEHSKLFRPGPIDLLGTSSLTRDYSDAVAYFRSYSLKQLPSDDELVRDLNQLVSLYALLVNRGGTHSLDSITLQDVDQVGETIPALSERRRYVRHYSIERNPRTAMVVKRLLGTTCQVCDFNFARVYGEHGEGYIEAHHLTPLHTLPEDSLVSMDPAKDFAVLCSNCHRMVHRSSKALSIAELRALVLAGN